LRIYLRPSLETLDNIVVNGQSVDVQVAARNTRDIILKRLRRIGL